MEKFSGYSETKTNDFTPSEKIELGSHLCKILKAYVQTINYTGGSFKQLILEFDITEPDAQAGFYARRFKEDADNDATSAKWKGIFKLSIPKDDGSENDEKTKTNFKTVITSIEKSNSGYDWEKADWDEKTLVGKVFAGVFGIEEFESPSNGELIYFTRCKFVRSTENMDKISIPKVKLLDKTYMDYEEWLENKKNNKNNNAGNNNTNSVNDSSDDDLPF